MSVFLLTSQRNAMRALASQGIFATDCHAQVSSIIAQHLSPAHAALIAEPQHDPGQQRIDWYASVNGTATPVSALPPEEAEHLRARAGELARDILHLSEQWGKDAQSREALAGQMLALVLQHPHEDDLWSVDGQPVLVNWGFAPGAVGAMPQDLSRMGGAIPVAASAAPVAAAAVPAAAAGSGCLGWLLPLLLALLLLWLLLVASSGLEIWQTWQTAGVFMQQDAIFQSLRVLLWLLPALLWTLVARSATPLRQKPALVIGLLLSMGFTLPYFMELIRL